MQVLFKHIDWEAAAADLRHLPSEIIGNVPDDWTNEQIEKDGDAVLLQLVGHFVNGFEFEIIVDTAKREEYKRLKKLADDAQSALHPFGEYDR